jgi:hypothetical protein
MNADVFFSIGTTHKVCQDYARCRPHEKQPYAILADGCSSAEDTDLGARLLVKNAERFLRVGGFYSLSDKGNIDSYLFNSVLSAQGTSAALQLHNDALCATLLTAKLEGDDFQAIVVGDGIVAARTPDGLVVVHEYHFASGAPYYLRYELEERTKKGYFKQFGTKGTHITYAIHPNGEISDKHELPFLFDEENIFFEERFPVKDFEAVALFTDGATSFLKRSDSSTSRQNMPVDSAQILKELTTFKGYVGEFAQRRAQRAMKNFIEKGIRNADDLGFAVLAKDQK